MVIRAGSRCMFGDRDHEGSAIQRKHSPLEGSVCWLFGLNLKSPLANLNPTYQHPPIGALPVQVHGIYGE